MLGPMLAGIGLKGLLVLMVTCRWVVALKLPRPSLIMLLTSSLKKRHHRNTRRLV
jgi:hypothetical protein